MNVSIPHTLTQEEAKAKLTALLQQLKTQFGAQIQDLTEEWTGYTAKIEGSAKGYSVSGTLDVQPDKVDIDLELPFLLKVFGSTIKSAVEDRVKKELS